MNVVLVIFDTLREDCISCLGSPPWGKVYTPNIDAFARESVVIPRCYPEALPTLQARRAIYTGRRVTPFKENYRYKGDFIGAPGWGPIPEDQITISEILQSQGYTTGLISDIQHMFKPSKNFHRGFDEWIWVRGYEADSYRSGPLPSKEEIEFWLPEELRESIYINFLKKCLMNVKDNKNEEDYSVARVMTEAVRWLKQNKDKDKKFLIVESWSPHEPWFVPDYYRKKYLREELHQQVISPYMDVTNLPSTILDSTRANYSGLVSMCDKWFGYLIENLNDLGMLDDTLIIVTTDHGHSLGDNGYIGKRGYPSSPEVFKIPVFIRHPDNNLVRGIKSNIMVQHIDITATILDILNIKSFKGNLFKLSFDPIDEKEIETKFDEIPIDGISFYNTLINGKEKFRDHVTVGWGTAVTVINDNWWLNCRVNGKGPFLYDISKNKDLEKNVADLNPNLVKQLFKLAKKDIGKKFPDYLIDMANKEKDFPGCSSLAAENI